MFLRRSNEESSVNVLNYLQFGTFPVFVVDGVPSAMKSQARIARFYRNLDVNQLDFPVVEEGVSVERNSAFTRCVQECVVS